jgi:hypothetical protein
MRWRGAGAPKSDHVDGGRAAQRTVDCEAGPPWPRPLWTPAALVVGGQPDILDRKQLGIAPDR